MTDDFDTDDFDDEPSVVVETVERRDAPRGPVRGMRATLPGRQPSEVLEAGVRGLFVACAELDSYQPGQSFQVTVTRDELSFDCEVEVVRVEATQRHGLAMKITMLDKASELIFDAMRT